MIIEKISISELVSPEWNPRQITDLEMKKLKDSINEFGYVDPIIVNRYNNHVVGGNQRLRALKELGFTEVDVIFIEEPSIEREKALNVSLNNISGDWDPQRLEDIFKDLELAGFDLKLTSFDDLQLQDLELDIDTSNFYENVQVTDEPQVEIVDDDYAEPDEEELEVTVEKGDLYQLGNHYLLCGDATLEEDVEKLVTLNYERERELMDLFLTDPPYNVNYGGGVKEGNPQGHRVRKIENDHFDSDEEAGEKLWKPAFKNARDIANPYCSVYCFMPQGGTHMMMMMMMRASWQVKHELIWVKNAPVLSRADYNYQHEPILYGWGEKHKFYGKGQYATTSIWKFNRPYRSDEHPTMKPLDLLGEILLNATEEGQNVYDCFGGSGSTLIACEQLNRNCYMIELTEHYCQVIINRWEEFTGKKAKKLN